VNTQFWLDKWAANQIGFHEDKVHPLLAAHWDALGIDVNAPVFVPLCGKSKDMLWLRERGHEIVGVELSEIAVAAFFSENGIAVERDEYAGFGRFHGGGYTLLCGDSFNLNATILGPFAAFYDRAALIALAQETRDAYAVLLRGLCPANCPGLLITVSYPPDAVSPPPFLVSREEIDKLYGHWAAVERLGEA
jgi:thiopurine S-methyltransferase